ncbi:T9SS type A sorting domain-containing protein, partial [bacterium]|nr:T9SS type A sorting domain-containing protein [bacterium]
RSRVTPPGETRAHYRLVIDPADTMLLVGQTLNYAAYIMDSTGARLDTTVTWSLQGNAVGILSEEGEFTAMDPGIGIVKAQIPRFTAVARILVATEAGMAESDTAQVRFRDREGNQVGHIRRIAEKDVLKISGLPFPLNILNGGQVLLPPGSLDQGISLEITLPDIAEILDSTVTFTEGIITGFSFDVYEDGILVHPYVFDPPVQIVLPYKPELLEELGLNAEDLAVFFYNPDGTYDPSGILNIVVDETENKIYAEVSHFSQVVAGDKKLYSTTGCCSRIESVMPLQNRLYPNYPNPFNPETAFRFDVGGRTAQDVSIEVYNMNGQRVAVILEKRLEPGQYSATWNGTNRTGQTVGSGVYLIRMKTASVTLTRRMVLMR